MNKFNYMGKTLDASIGMQFFDFSECIGSIDKYERIKLVKLYYAILEIYFQYIFPIDDNAKQQFNSEYLKTQIETRKNVDEAILKTIQDNINVLFIKGTEMGLDKYRIRPLWYEIMGYSWQQTLLPKTTEFIMKHPKAFLVRDTMIFGIIPFETVHRDRYLAKLASEIPHIRTYQEKTTKCNIGIQAAAKLEKKWIANLYDEDDFDYEIPIIDMFLEHKDCSIQQDIQGRNIGIACVLSARYKLWEYLYMFYREIGKIKRKNFEEGEKLDQIEQRARDELTNNIISPQAYELKIKILNDDLRMLEASKSLEEIEIKNLEKILDRKINNVKRIADLALKSMTLYPETAEQQLANGETLKNLYAKLLNDIYNKKAYSDEEAEQEKQQQEEKEKALKLLIASPEELSRRLKF